MKRSDFQRLLHDARVEAYALALYDLRPGKGRNSPSLDAKMLVDFGLIAEHHVSEMERHGLFTAEMERVA